MKKTITLKPQYRGVCISRIFPGLGSVTFDSSKGIPEEEILWNYHKLGFEYLFDIKEVDTKATYVKLEKKVVRKK